MATVLPTKPNRGAEVASAPANGKLAQASAPAREDGSAAREKPRRRKTSHLKIVPEPRELREKLKARCMDVAAKLDKARPLGKEEMESLARQILDEYGLPEGHVGWTMVVLASEFWRSQVATVPHNRRLLLLPHCLKHAEGCPADYDEFGLDCKKCGACTIADYRTTAENLGYKVLVAEGSPIVLKIIVSGYVDAIVGVACLNVLEKAIDKILLAGIPCMAVPLLSSDCRNTSVDEEWVSEMIALSHVTEPAHEQTRSYVHLMRAASRMFERQELERLAPRQRGGPSLADLNGQGVAALDPIAGTEAIAYDFLAKGGKHSRPFITLAVYDAVTGGRATSGDGARHLESLDAAAKRVAMSIETFHKASLVHDDIEDGDEYRYGDQTLHRKYGTATAINVGDYLIGMGYRLVSREAKTLGAEVVSDILDRLADAHLKLSEGQGAELLWRDTPGRQIAPLDALKIYALKTAPAFEAAIFSGLRMAGPIDKYLEPICQFARHLGVAFQILNDLGDWRGDNHNKLVAAGDVLGGRPTVLWALALEGLNEAGREELRRLTSSKRTDAILVSRVRQLYAEAGVFEKANRLVEKYRQRAEAVADEIEPVELRQLLYYLIDTVLADESHAEPEVIEPLLPIVAR